MIRPVPYAPTQLYGANPTRYLPWDSWLIQTFGNYQPDGHTGEDYPCPAGTPVKAVTSGIVRHVGYFNGSYADNPWWIAPGFAGFTYVVDHGWFVGIYGHCMDGAASVSAGQRVTEGQVLGLSGNTGASTGPHLHFEVLPDGYILQSVMYGRINPNSLFIGSITPQSATINSIEEDFLATFSEDEKNAHFEALSRIDNRTANIEKKLGEIPSEQYWDDAINAIARIDQKAAAPEIAAQINAAGIAVQVRDELVKLIGGK